ncbi:MAG TPA: Fe-S cluster assembly protein SufD [Candidatus Polarisedimenticolaceae bacterium]|nr:Fe-S cluster assembly protein SufD [Candidatus Polarisedimenticolaceae bacterium]
MNDRTKATNSFLDGFRELERVLTRNGPGWLVEARRGSRARFDQLGFPTTNEEAWRNTNVSPIAQGSFRPAERATISFDRLPALARLDLGGPRVVLVDGHLDPSLSRLDPLPRGLEVDGLGRLLARDPDAVQSWWSEFRAEDGSAFRALNTTLAQDGAVVRTAPRTIVDHPLHVVHVATGETAARGSHNATHSRCLVSAGEASRLHVVESYVAIGAEPYLTNAVTEVELADGAVLQHDRIQLESAGAYHIATVDSRQRGSTLYVARHFNFGGKLVRNELRSRLDGDGGNCTIDGLYVTRGSQHVDNHTLLDHARPHCDSRELFKGILMGRSRTVFHGRIIVRQAAQKTDAKQSNPNLLLSGEALAHTRPQLEIYADDVKCTHGATIGQLDRDAIFYLRSRGIDDDSARNLLTAAFAGEILDRVTIEPLRELLAAEVGRRLAAG